MAISMHPADEDEPGPGVLVMVLPNGQTAEGYAISYAEDRAPDRSPYGLEHIGPGWRVGFSEQTRRSRWQRLVGSAAFRFSGVDLMGGLLRRRALLAADVVYAHTEVEYLAAAFALLGRRGPLLVGQTVWLFADVPRRPRLQRAVLRMLWRRVDLFVHNAAPNAATADRLIPRGRHALVPFGVSARFVSAAPDAVQRTPPLVVSVGNDRARDWPTLDDALRPLTTRVDVRIASGAQLPGFEYAVVAATASVTELVTLLETALCLVVTTAPNLHASGITAVLEAALAGTPVVATTGGGIEDYFPDGEVILVPPGDPGAVRQAVEELLADRPAAAARGRALRSAALTRDYTNPEYWARVMALVEPLRQRR